MSTKRVNENSLENNNTVEGNESQDILKKILEENLDEQGETSKRIPSTISESIFDVNLRTEQILKESGSLSSLDELAQRLLDEKGILKNEIEDDDSFVTVDGCQKDITTSTEPAIFFSVNERTQNILTARNEPSNYPPPPPYDHNTSAGYQGRLGATPIYQERYVGHPPSQAPRDASRAPPYGRYYTEEYEHVLDAFDSKRIRNQFIRKVYMILSAQLVFTFAIIGLAVFEERVKFFIFTHPLLYLLAIGMYVISTVILFCYDESRRIFPINFILLIAVTVSMAYMMAGISCIYKTHIVLAAFGVTAGTCILVSLFACQTSYDVTSCGMFLMFAMIIIFIYGIVAIVITMLTGLNIVYLIYSCLATMLFYMFLMYDTQQILGGRRVELSPEEYILGALTLYIDIMIIFEYMLYILKEL